MAESAPAQHKFKLSVFQPNDPKNFIKFVRKEVKLLRTSLPAGIHVKGFEDRMVYSSSSKIFYLNPLALLESLHFSGLILCHDHGARKDSIREWSILFRLPTFS
jgi:hypothetical protein